MSKENCKILCGDDISRFFGRLSYSKKESLAKALEDIFTYVESCEEDRDKAYATLREYNKDEEIAKLMAEIDELRNRKSKGISFVVTEEELAEINAWQDEHIKKYHGGDAYAGAIGGRFSYRFIPTSIGDIGYVYCSHCKEKGIEDSEFCFRELC